MNGSRFIASRFSVPALLVGLAVCLGCEDDSPKFYPVTKYFSIHDAAANGDLEAVKNMLGQGTDIDETDQGGMTALHNAAFQGHFDVVKFLVRNKADMDLQDSRERTALHYVVMRANPEIKDYLIKKGARRDIEDDTGMTAESYERDYSDVDSVIKFGR